MSVTNVLIKAALDHVQLQNPTVFAVVNRDDLESHLQDSLDATLPKEFSLSATKPDFEEILFSFVQELQTDQAWKDIVHTGTGQTLLRNFSAGVSYLHFAIVRAVQNSFLLPNSTKDTIYQGMNFLGVNVRRRVPNKLAVRLSIPDHNSPFIIPRFTQFIVGNELFFNRTDITFTAFELYKDVTLHQGTIFARQGVAEGIPYETISVGYENFAISNDDVYVKVNDEYWATDNKIRPWMATKDQKIVFTKTSETGNVEILFGNGIYAKKLEASDELEIIWAETKGLGANHVLSDTHFVQSNLDLEVTGITLSPSYGGDNELDLSTYANLGSHIMASSGVGIRRADFKALALEYPTIRDAIFKGQAEYAPGIRVFQNVVKSTVLTNTASGLMSPMEWLSFTDYLAKRSTFSLIFEREDPLIIDVVVNATIYCNTRANLSDINSVLTNAVKALTVPKPGVLGYSLYASDVISVLEGNFENDQNYSKLIEYVPVDSFSFTQPVVDAEVEDQEEVDTESEEENSTSVPEILPIPTLLEPQDVSAIGIQDNGKSVIAGYHNYVRITDVNLDIRYTSRRTYFGRTDLSSEG